MHMYNWRWKLWLGSILQRFPLSLFTRIIYTTVFLWNQTAEFLCGWIQVISLCWDCCSFSLCAAQTKQLTQSTKTKKVVDQDFKRIRKLFDLNILRSPLYSFSFGALFIPTHKMISCSVNSWYLELTIQCVIFFCIDSNIWSLRYAERKPLMSEQNPEVLNIVQKYHLYQKEF